MTFLTNLNNYFWPKDMENIAAYLGNDNPDKLRRLKIYRIIALIIYIGIYVHSYFGMDGQYLYYVIAFTQWGLFLTSLSLFFLFIAVNVKGKRKFIHKFAFVLFEIAWTSEVVITVVFWSILVVIDFREAYKYNAAVISFMVESHSLPLIMLSLDFYQSQMEFKKRHGLFVAILPTLYAGVSILLAAEFDIFTYSILTWRDYTSFLYGILFLFLFIFAFTLGYLIGERRRNRKLQLMDSPHEIIIREDNMSLVV